jgi:hypothetical protein
MGKAAKAEDLDRTGTLGPVLDELVFSLGGEFKEAMASFFAYCTR